MSYCGCRRVNCELLMLTASTYAGLLHEAGGALKKRAPKQPKTPETNAVLQLNPTCQCLLHPLFNIIQKYQRGKQIPGLKKKNTNCLKCSLQTSTAMKIDP